MADSKTTTTSGEFAIIKTAGKQYIVSVGDVITLDKHFDNFKEGGKIVFDEVLLTDTGSATTVGAPTVKGKKVEGIFQTEGKAKKVRVSRFRAKSRHHRVYGHRQPMTKIKISAIA